MDGIKSVVRKAFLTNEGLLKSPSFEPVWSGTYAYRGTVPFEKLSELLPGHGAIDRPMKVRSAMSFYQPLFVNIDFASVHWETEGVWYSGITGHN